MSRKTRSVRLEGLQRNIALCYIRQSRTQDVNDRHSPERQRANIAAVCEQRGWTPEWYEDADGHKSGTTEARRPGWLALKKRLGDPDVAAIVANEQSRFHRNLTNTSKMIDLLVEHNVILVLAENNMELDVNTLTGQMLVQFRGLMDAFYAKDISGKSRDSARFRKKMGKTLGKPPFGTQRDAEGFLEPSIEGAWLLPDGTFVAGIDDDEPPQPGAIWRGYHACAERVLQVYVARSVGMHVISYQMNEEGWAFRDRYNQPRPINANDIRRIVSSWPAYGGLVHDRPAKSRPGYEDPQIDSVVFVEDRLIFPDPLLRSVAKARFARGTKPVNRGVNTKTYPYVLSGLLYCAHCETLAEQHDNPKLRSRLGGSQGRNQTRRYRHLGGVKCGSKNRSVFTHELDADFGRLVKLLSIKPEAIELMTELAILADQDLQKDSESIAEQKAAAIAMAQRRIDAAVNLYRQGYISIEEFERDVEANKREIAHWEARTIETERLAMELTMCMQAVDNISAYWDVGEEEDRQALVQALFTEVIYNLDTRRIESFKLKPWADRFLMLRGMLYGLEEEASDGGDDEEGGDQAASNSASDASAGSDNNEQQPLRRNPVWGISVSTP